MDTQELYERGLALRRQMLGREAVDRRMRALGDFGRPLQEIINAYAYGEVWSRAALPLATKSLVMVGMLAAAGKPAELRIHLKGAIANGCSREELQDVLLLVALYCGLPAANEAHNAAVELFGDAAKDGDK